MDKTRREPPPAWLLTVRSMVEGLPPMVFTASNYEVTVSGALIIFEPDAKTHIIAPGIWRSAEWAREGGWF
jgi:hypothetical protein